MASPALDAFRAWVDGTALSAAQKALAKQRGEQLYAAGAKETIQHLRLHAQAILNDAGATIPEKNRAQQVLTITDAVIARADSDPWWLAVVGAI